TCASSAKNSWRRTLAATPCTRPRPRRRSMRLDIRSRDRDLGDRLRDVIERKLRFTLARYCPRIRRVSLHVTELNGAPGSRKTLCRITARLVPAGEVSVEITEADLDTAVDRVATG